jgi:hypothetical protein
MNAVVNIAQLIPVYVALLPLLCVTMPQAINALVRVAHLENVAKISARPFFATLTITWWMLINHALLPLFVLKVIAAPQPLALTMLISNVSLALPATFLVQAQTPR